jgi:3-deoxy-D-manno-octulosonate cytidylyltransferase
MQIVGVIPARYHSSRLDGKVLASIAGQPMIQHVWSIGKRAKSLDRVIIATDDHRIETVASSFGAEVVMTDPGHRSGTDRVAQVTSEINCDVVVNIQGDEPMLEPCMIDEVVAVFRDDQKTQFATLAQLITNQDILCDPNVVKVVCDHKGNALYFSRSPIPYSRPENGLADTQPLKHIGLYAYTKTCLQSVSELPPTKLEQVERLEQLRALENGIPIRVVRTQSTRVLVGVDTPEDLEIARNCIESER